MKKILFVLHTLQAGGAEKVFINLLKHINKDKYDVTVLAIVNDGLYIEELKKIDKVKYKWVFPSFFCKSRNNKNSGFYNISNKIMDFIWKIYIFMLKYFSGIIYRLRVKEKFDIEIAFLEGKVAKFVSNSNNKESEKIVWVHTDVNNVSGINIFKNIEEEKAIYSKFNKIICVSSDVKKKLIEKLKLENKNIFVQANPIDSQDIIEKSREILPKQYNCTKKTIIVTVGRLVKEKGFDRLLKVHRNLIHDGLEHELWIIGEGKERKNLENYIKKYKLNKTVKLVGYVENPYKYIKKADIFVCSSRVEGLSSAVLEATILGKPIVSTNCPGTSDILGNNNEGAIIVENSVKGIYDGIKEMLQDEGIRKEYQERIKSRAQYFKIDYAIENIEKILDMKENDI